MPQIEQRCPDTRVRCFRSNLDRLELIKLTPGNAPNLYKRSINSCLQKEFRLWIRSEVKFLCSRCILKKPLITVGETSGIYSTMRRFQSERLKRNTSKSSKPKTTSMDRMRNFGQRCKLKFENLAWVNRLSGFKHSLHILIFPSRPLQMDSAQKGQGGWKCNCYRRGQEYSVVMNCIPSVVESLLSSDWYRRCQKYIVVMSFIPGVVKKLIFPNPWILSRVWSKNFVSPIHHCGRLALRKERISEGTKVLMVRLIQKWWKVYCDYEFFTGCGQKAYFPHIHTEGVKSILWLWILYRVCSKSLFFSQSTTVGG